jgi:hypothetical protein
MVVLLHARQAWFPQALLLQPEASQACTECCLSCSKPAASAETQLHGAYQFHCCIIWGDGHELSELVACESLRPRMELHGISFYDTVESAHCEAPA